MMKSTEERQSDDVTSITAFNFTRLWRIFMQTQVGPMLMVVDQVFLQRSAQVPFVQDNKSVKTFTTDGSDHAFCISVFPRLLWFPKTHMALNQATIRS